MFSGKAGTCLLEECDSEVHLHFLEQERLGVPGQSTFPPSAQSAMCCPFPLIDETIRLSLSSKVDYLILSF